jgi:hypothetical protein
MPQTITKREATIFRAWTFPEIPIDSVIMASTTKLVPPAKSVLKELENGIGKRTVYRSERSMLWRKTPVGSRLKISIEGSIRCTCDEKGDCEVEIVESVKHDHIASRWRGLLSSREFREGLSSLRLLY